MRGYDGDPMLASWLLDPGRESHGLDFLSQSFLGVTKIPTSAVIDLKAGQTMDSAPVATVLRYACEDAQCTWRLAQVLEAKLAEQYRLQGVVRTGFDGMEVELVGGKFNLTDVAARVGLGQLPHLEEFNAKRRELARAYFELLDAPAARALGLGLPPRDFTSTNWHMFQVVLPEDKLSIKRADVMAQLHAAGIGTGVHYPAIHRFAVYRRLGWKDGDLPIAEGICRSILTLPLFPTMTRADAVRVVDALVGILQRHLKP